MSLIACARTGSLAWLKPDRAAHYRRLHAAPWPEVLQRIARSNLRNYSIFEKELDGRPVLFSYFEHTGADRAADMAAMAADAPTQRWWAECVPCLDPLPKAARRGQVWDEMEEVYFFEGDAGGAPASVRRVGTVTGLRFEKEELYRSLHANPWPGVKRTILEAHIRNYSIFLKLVGEKLYLFSYFEYVGPDFEGDMRRIGECDVTQRWWKHTDACQAPLSDAAARGEIWSPMTEVFHTD